MIEWLIGGAVATYLYKKASDKGDIICAARNNPYPIHKELEEFAKVIQTSYFMNH